MGEVELDGDVLVLRRVHVRYVLQVDGDVDRAKVDRVMGFYASRCPVHRSLEAAIAFTDEIELVEAQSPAT